ncbi:MAG TPA: hypothetical protein VMV02_06355 [Acidimicrobiales bacterium]|nr:hypothetical protein [Acidimicrobiales bacterium]
MSAPRARRATARAAAAVAAAVGLAACSGLTGSHAHKVAQWAAGAGVLASVRLVKADVRAVGAGIAREALVATHTACDGLASDAASAYGELPTPDVALTDALSAAYLAYTRAAQDCSDAGSFAAGAFARYQREVAIADRELRGAERRLAALGVR